MEFDLIVSNFILLLGLPTDLALVVSLRTGHLWPWQLSRRSYESKILKITAMVLKETIASDLQKNFDIHFGMSAGTHVSFPKTSMEIIAGHIKEPRGEHLLNLIWNHSPSQGDIAGLVEVHQNLVNLGVDSAYFAQALGYAQALAQVKGMS